MNNYEYTELNEELNDKRVILVGRSSYLLKETQGKFIDSFDVVVRLNHAPPYSYNKSKNHLVVPDVLHTHIGKKTHIYYRSWGSVAYKQLSRFADNGGIVLTYCWAHIPYPFRRVDNNIVDFDDIKEMKQYVGCRSVTPASYISLKSQYHKFSINTPHIGMIAVAELLNYPIKELFMIGFTHYSLPEEKKIYNKIMKTNYHNVETDMLWLKEKIETDDRLYVGNMLNSIMTERFPGLKCQI